MRQNSSLQLCKERILAYLKTKSVMEYYGIVFNGMGFARCPFHNEKTASMSIKNNHYKCFGCGEYGGVIDFVVKYFGLSFKDALSKIDSDFGLGVIGKPVTLAENHKIKQLKIKQEELKRKHNTFRTLYRTKTDFFRYLQNAITEFRPMDPEQPADEWNLNFVYAAQNLDRLERWLDENINIYSDITLFEKYKTEGRLTSE